MASWRRVTMSHVFGAPRSPTRSGLKRPRISRRGAHLGEAHREASRERDVAERERAEVKLEIALELHEMDRGALEGLEHAIDEARHHLELTEAVSAQEEDEPREEASERASIERARRGLFDARELEAAHRAVRADLQARVDRREAAFVIEELDEMRELFHFAQRLAELADANEAALGSLEAARHPLDERADGGERVDAMLMLFDDGAVRGRRQRVAERDQLEVRVLEIGAQRGAPRELVQDGATKRDGRRILRRVGEHALEVALARRERAALDRDRERLLHELGQEDLARELRRIVGRSRRARFVEGARETVGAVTSSERERDRPADVAFVDAECGLGRQEVGDGRHVGPRTADWAAGSCAWGC
jgi:hypothetical protein